MKFRLFIVKQIMPWLVIYAVATGNSELLCWAIVELPKIVTAGGKGEGNG